jgi:hypothetical protein
VTYEESAESEKKSELMMDVWVAVLRTTCVVLAVRRPERRSPAPKMGGSAVAGNQGRQKRRRSWTMVHDMPVLCLPQVLLFVQDASTRSRAKERTKSPQGCEHCSRDTNTLLKELLYN